MTSAYGIAAAMLGHGNSQEQTSSAEPQQTQVVQSIIRDLDSCGTIAMDQLAAHDSADPD